MLSEIGLDKANDPPNPNIPPSPKTFQLILGAHSAPKTQVVSDDQTHIDQWNIPSTVSTGCNPVKLSRTDLYAVLTIPKPDIIVGLLPEPVGIKREDSTEKLLGPPDIDKRLYATQLELLYRAVTIEEIRVCHGNPKDPQKPVVFWPELKDSPKCTQYKTPMSSPLFRVLCGQISLTFDMQRKVDDPVANQHHVHNHAIAVNEVIGTMVGIHRVLDYKGLADNASHGDCLNPGIIICSGSSTICTTSN